MTRLTCHASDFEFCSYFIDMPVTKQAIKKIRADREKTVYNLRRKITFKKAVSAFRKNPTPKLLQTVYRVADLAAKTNVIHKNRAARIKSRLSKLLKPARTISKRAKKKKEGTNSVES